MTFDGICPIWKIKGRCGVGFKCRFVGSHMKERELADGRKELVLVEEECGLPSTSESGTLNEVSTQAKIDLMKRNIETPNADKYTKWIETSGKEIGEQTRMDGRGRFCEGAVRDTEVSLIAPMAALLLPKVESSGIFQKHQLPFVITC